MPALCKHAWLSVAEHAGGKVHVRLRLDLR